MSPPGSFVSGATSLYEQHALFAFIEAASCDAFAYCSFDYGIARRIDPLLLLDFDLESSSQMATVELNIGDDLSSDLILFCFFCRRAEVFHSCQLSVYALLARG